MKNLFLKIEISVITVKFQSFFVLNIKIKEKFINPRSRESKNFQIIDFGKCVIINKGTLIVSSVSDKSK
ncbi:hypothetical protein [Sedimentibacter sp. MB31-C6]|uniref:hypothetical protein n=1 Tax=Sedimentibacter sp. MB31-C6 TaxID=3109366 RepID=UPI002DDCA2AC|nr:hypothetical protein [Sedimentibacter sp. MB36-C1]WSI04051.1 hypothetical protein U8307_13775 [Sedimentibacter sp. MB36-C1]